MDVQPTNLQQLCDAIMSIWTKISEEYFQHLVESMPQKLKAVLKAKGGSNLVWQGVHNKVASECISSYIWKRLLSFFLYKNLSMITPWTVKTCERQVSFSLTVSNSISDNALVLIKGHRALLNGHCMYLLQKTLWNICESICNIFSHQYLLSLFSPPLK